MLRCIDNMIPLNSSTSCLQPRKARRPEEARKWSSSTYCRVPPAGSIRLLFVFTLHDDELQADCSGPRGRPLCITLRWMTVWGGQGVFTTCGWLRRWTPAVTVCLPTEAGYKASILSHYFISGSNFFFFFYLVRFCHLWCNLHSASVMNNKSCSVSDSLASMKRK